MRKVLYIMGQLSDDDVEWLADTGLRESIPAGQLLIEEGKQAGFMYILLDGKMSVSISKLGEVAQLGSGEVIGEMSLIDSRPPSASITAVDDSVVLSFSHEILTEKLEGDIGFAARFYRALATFLSDRMRGTVQRMGYGEDGAGLDDDTELEGELDLNVLDNVHLAGARFDRMLKRLMGN